MNRLSLSNDPMSTQVAITPIVALPVAEPDDVELVRRARAGDAWGHEAIYRRYVQRVAGVARRLLRDGAEVDDVVQETFLIAFQKIDALAEPGALRGWLTQIAVSRVHRRFRWPRWIHGDIAAALADQISHDATP